ncbi:uncharacterized protein LOC104683866 [Corvus cornix cornix]|uniref:uncharacterized protein LOC104683866 n=1 Tax=Corvus cornix cornix TaxID=932674 RepID=UPI0019512DD5|nr:uncharacterized protein LOC104683866 [Corvus cornix cornix]
MEFLRLSQTLRCQGFLGNGGVRELLFLGFREFQIRDGSPPPQTGKFPPGFSHLIPGIVPNVSSEKLLGKRKEGEKWENGIKIPSVGKARAQGRPEPSESQLFLENTAFPKGLFLENSGGSKGLFLENMAFPRELFLENTAFSKSFSWRMWHSQGAFPGKHSSSAFPKDFPWKPWRFCVPKEFFLENTAFPRGFSWKTAVVPKGFPWKRWWFHIPEGKENLAIPWNFTMQPGKAAGSAIPIPAFPEVLQHPGNGGAVPAAGKPPPCQAVAGEASMGTIPPFGGKSRDLGSTGRSRSSGQSWEYTGKTGNKGPWWGPGSVSDDISMGTIPALPMDPEREFPPKLRQLPNKHPAE